MKIAKAIFILNIKKQITQSSGSLEAKLLFISFCFYIHIYLLQILTFTRLGKGKQHPKYYMLHISIDML